jgi:uncharacterized protein (DUF302 family)
MDETKYGLRLDLKLPYETAIERITVELQEQGFGVLTRIDVKETLKKKLDQDFRRYVILGACNPQLAHRALQVELEIGLLLPCNVIVYEVEPGRSVVAAMAPLTALGIVGSSSLQDVAKEADRRLRASLESVAASAGPE